MSDKIFQLRYKQFILFVILHFAILLGICWKDFQLKINILFILYIIMYFTSDMSIIFYLKILKLLFKLGLTVIIFHERSSV